MPAPLSAIDAISPAFEHTKRLLFQPFRAGFWARLAVVAFITGEYLSGSWGGSGGGGGGGSSTGTGGDPEEFFFLLADPTWEQIQPYLAWIVAGGVAVMALGLLWTYIASVFRFVLFDAVITNRCYLRAGWHRWQTQGASYFLWQLGLALGMVASLAVVLGLPALFGWWMGVFESPKEHVALVIGGIAVGVFLVLAWVIVGMLAWLFAKDFVVPFMALENVGVIAGWRRVWPLLQAEKMAYAGYVGMKIVLAVGAAMLFGIILVILFLVLLILLGVVGASVFLAGKSAGLEWDAFTITAAVVLGVVLLAGLIYFVSVVFVPAMVFFQSYTVHFLGSRYPRLGALLNPAPPSPPVPAPAPAPAT